MSSRSSVIARAASRLAVLFPLVLAACGGGDSGTAPNPPATQGGFTITLSSSALTLEQGATGTLTASLARTGSFAGSVALTAENVPTGLTVTFNPNVVASGTTSATMSIVAAATLGPGAYSFLIRAQASGLVDQAASVSLTITAAPAASIALTATPSALSVQAGGVGVSTTIGIARTNFTGTVVVAVQSGLPTGVTATNTPSGPVASNSVVVAFSATAAAVPGTYNVVLQGAGFQATSGTVTIALTVTPGAGSSSVALSATPSSLSVAPGSTTSTVIGIARTNFTGTVNLAASGAPSAVTLSLSTTATTGSTATLGVAVGSGATVGSYPLTITASGNGIATTQLGITLVVTPISSGGNVAWVFCTPTGFPVWFAYQDGGPTAPWTQVQMGAGNRYAFDIGTRGAVAYVMQNNPDNFTLNVVHGTRAELGSQGTATCPAQGTTLKTVTGTVTGFATATDFATVAVGSAFAQTSPTQGSPSFTIVGVPDGVRDLVATRSTFNAANVSNPLTLNKIFLKRGINPPNLSSVGTVDFNGTDAFDPATTPLTINGAVAGEQVAASNTFITNTQSFGSLGAVSLVTGSTLNLNIVPPSRTVAGDVQAIAVNAATISGTLATQIRSVTAVFRDPANATVTLGAVVNTPSITTLSTAPYARLNAQVTRQSDYQDSWIASFAQFATASRRTVNITMSVGYAGASSSLDLRVPDFTGVSGWQNTWGPIAGNLTSWNVAMTGWISVNGGLVDGALFRTGQRQGTITP